MTSAGTLEDYKLIRRELKRTNAITDAHLEHVRETTRLIWEQINSRARNEVGDIEIFGEMLFATCPTRPRDTWNLSKEDMVEVDVRNIHTDAGVGQAVILDATISFQITQQTRIMIGSAIITFASALCEVTVCGWNYSGIVTLLSPQARKHVTVIIDDLDASDDSSGMDDIYFHVHEDANGNVCLHDDNDEDVVQEAGDVLELGVSYDDMQTQEECASAGHVPLAKTPEEYAKVYVHKIEALRNLANSVKPWAQTVSNILYHPHTRELLSRYKGAVEEFDQGIEEALENFRSN